VHDYISNLTGTDNVGACPCDNSVVGFPSCCCLVSILQRLFFRRNHTSAQQDTVSSPRFSSMMPTPLASSGTTIWASGTSRTPRSSPGPRASRPSLLSSLRSPTNVVLTPKLISFSRWQVTQLQFFLVEGPSTQVGVLIVGIGLTLVAIAATLVFSRYLKKTLKVD